MDTIYIGAKQYQYRQKIQMQNNLIMQV